MKFEGDERTFATPPVSARAAKKPPRPEPQLIGHLPRAEEEAMRTFVEIKGNHYQYGTLGRSREALESMTCDCQYEHGVDDEEMACGHSSDCINRLTQVECLPDDCRCRSYCQNQRFQRKEYADIEVVKTEKKGFGLRAGADLRKDTFIYEYVGDVVSQPSFLKRMRQYAEENIRHFYFMMLQKDEFIDATKRGGIGRFANHSCNPNCYVAKWTIGEHVRMGIFANRYIKKDEELTFNYNVDRYGNDAQPCYCGEPNCVGFIGGKTQTDLAAMDDLYLDALGISEEVESLGLKGSKKKKGKKLDEDYLPTLKPIILRDVPKVIQAMRQTQSRKVMFKLLTRIKMTEDQAALRQLMRLRGFSLMTNILEDYDNDLEITTLVSALECMMTWPLIQRNKVEDSKVNIPVQACAQSENTVLAEMAKKLLEQWEALEYAYRIPKRVKGDGGEEHWESVIVLASDDPERPHKRRREDELLESVSIGIKPLGYRQSQAAPPSTVQTPRHEAPQPKPVSYAPKKEDIAATIAAAQRAALAAKQAAEQEAAAKAAEERKREAKEARQRDHKHQKQSNEEREANKEKRLMKLVGAIVVKCMSKYQKQMDHDTFKKHAKEIIADKEKKSTSYKEGKLDALSDEKVAKIKKFAKEYIAKVLRKLDKSGQRRKPSSSSGSGSHPGDAPTMSTSTPDDADDADDTLIVTNLSVEDMMDLDPDYLDNSRDGEDGADHQSFEHDRHSERSESALRENGEPHSGGRFRSTSVSDPRRRHRNEECGWDPDQEKPSVLQGPSVVSVGS
ncbi:hypothetical protein CERSUDRAFT_54162 [Gelatoporia subvermispora B]|uniref:Histone-lysine N-methyltransferase, H3 lysine-36 specific n=1 Tax=Ceriporiopsis subvermispora (strain B) TaxID=914234 RepID=M2R8T4_CERS8|nr:hypothetical protein CERSUDRAFT_54162 [Gelatoporia subvermispora B]